MTKLQKKGPWVVVRVREGSGCVLKGPPEQLCGDR